MAADARAFRWRTLASSERTRPALRRLALSVVENAYEKQMSQDFRDAERLYEQSLEVFPTAEARTFLGWTYSMQGNFTGAIRECENAIRMDPEFGNPYNDIGAYLIELGRWNEAIPWLERAVAAPRYEARHYAYMNLGRIHQREMDWDRAKAMFVAALSLSPDYLPALLALPRMMSRFN